MIQMYCLLIILVLLVPFNIMYWFVYCLPCNTIRNVSFQSFLSGLTYTQFYKLFTSNILVFVKLLNHIKIEEASSLSAIISTSCKYLSTLTSVVSDELIEAAPSETVPSNMRNAQIQISLLMRKVYPGPLLSIHTFCSIQRFC